MNEELLAEAYKALEKAKDALNTARHDRSGGFNLATVNRAYYSMFIA